MLTIQEVGNEILSNNPRSFYVLAGTEYGIKRKYLEVLKKHYGRFVESPSALDLIKMMSTKHIVPLDPTLYIVRYDDEFLRSLSDKTAKKLEKAKIVGTIVCLYESDTALSKLSKYLPEYTVSMPPVDNKYVKKYLVNDFPDMPDRLTSLAVSVGTGYESSYNICQSMSATSYEKLLGLSDTKLSDLFRCGSIYDEKLFKTYFAARNFSGMSKMLDSYEGDASLIIYSMLSVLLELEKILTTKALSEFAEYRNKWTLVDVYNMFMQCYRQLELLRSVTTDTRSSLLYLFSLLKFKAIPSVEELS